MVLPIVRCSLTQGRGRYPRLLLLTSRKRRYFNRHAAISPNVSGVTFDEFFDDAWVERWNFEPIGLCLAGQWECCIRRSIAVCYELAYTKFQKSWLFRDFQISAALIQHGERWRFAMAVLVRGDFEHRGCWRRKRRMVRRIGGFWRLLRSTTARRGQKRRRSAVSGFRSSGTGCCVSTHGAPTVFWTARRRGAPASSMMASARRSSG